MRASTMQLERCEAIELVLSFQGLVAIASSNEAFDLSGACHRLLKLKRPNLKKVTKELGSDFETPWSEELWQVIGRIKSARTDSVYSGAVSVGTTEP